MKSRKMQKNQPSFYVLKLNAHRGTICGDMGFWTHASPDIKALWEFVESLVHPHEGFYMTLLKIEVIRYTQLFKGGLFQWDSRWVGGSMAGDDWDSSQNNC